MASPYTSSNPAFRPEFKMKFSLVRICNTHTISDCAHMDFPQIQGSFLRTLKETWTVFLDVSKDLWLGGWTLCKVLVSDMLSDW